MMIGKNVLIFLIFIFFISFFQKTFAIESNEEFSLEKPWSGYAPKSLECRKTIFIKIERYRNEREVYIFKFETNET